MVPRFDTLYHCTQSALSNFGSCSALLRPFHIRLRHRIRSEGSKSIDLQAGTLFRLRKEAESAQLLGLLSVKLLAHLSV